MVSSYDDRAIDVSRPGGSEGADTPFDELRERCRHRAREGQQEHHGRRVGGVCEPEGVGTCWQRQADKDEDNDAHPVPSSMSVLAQRIWRYLGTGKTDVRMPAHVTAPFRCSRASVAGCCRRVCRLEPVGWMGAPVDGCSVTWCPCADATRGVMAGTNTVIALRSWLAVASRGYEAGDCGRSGWARRA